MSEVCEHSVCGACADKHFSSGATSCPVVSCGKFAQPVHFARPDLFLAGLAATIAHIGRGVEKIQFTEIEETGEVVGETEEWGGWFADGLGESEAPGDDMFVDAGAPAMSAPTTEVGREPDAPASLREEGCAVSLASNAAWGGGREAVPGIGADDVASRSCDRDGAFSTGHTSHNRPTGAGEPELNSREAVDYGEDSSADACVNGWRSRVVAVETGEEPAASASQSPYASADALPSQRGRDEFAVPAVPFKESSPENGKERERDSQEDVLTLPPPEAQPEVNADALMGPPPPPFGASVRVRPTSPEIDSQAEIVTQPPQAVAKFAADPLPNFVAKSAVERPATPPPLPGTPETPQSDLLANYLPKLVAESAVARPASPPAFPEIPETAESEQVTAFPNLIAESAVVRPALPGLPDTPEMSASEQLSDVDVCEESSPKASPPRPFETMLSEPSNSERLSQIADELHRGQQDHMRSAGREQEQTLLKLCVSTESREKRNRAVELCRSFGISIIQDLPGARDRATVVVTDNGARSDSYATLNATVRGIPVVDVTWLFECDKSGGILPYEPFILRGSAGGAGKNTFDGLVAVLDRSLDLRVAGEMTALLRNGGAVVLPDGDVDAAILPEHSAVGMVMMETEPLPSQTNLNQLKEVVHIISFDWIAECIKIGSYPPPTPETGSSGTEKSED